MKHCPRAVSIARPSTLQLTALPSELAAAPELERECMRLTMEIEDEALAWVNCNCTQQMKNCKTESELENCVGKLKKELNEKMTHLFSRGKDVLQKFFDDHPAKETITQWKSETADSLNSLCETQKVHMTESLDRKEKQLRFAINQHQVTSEQTQAIMQETVNIANQQKDSSWSDNELENQFDKIWKPWSDEIIAASP